MISVVVMLKGGVRSETVGLELPELGPDELAQVDDLFHEIRARIDRVAQIRAAKAKKAGGG